MLKLKLACPKHKRYDPERDGWYAIKGGCRYCQRLHDLYVAAQWVEVEFGRRTPPPAPVKEVAHVLPR